MTSRLTPTQLANALADADRRIQTVTDALTAFENTFGDGHEGFGVNWNPGDAWNALHNLHRDLVDDRDRIALNPRPLTYAEAASMALIHANID